LEELHFLLFIWECGWDRLKRGLLVKKSRSDSERVVFS